jgi:hypothetical protein
LSIRPLVAVALSALALVWAGCGPASPPLELPEGCQPLLGGLDCLLPYPSDYFRRDDATMPSGARFALTDAARQKTK